MDSQSASDLPTSPQTQWDAQLYDSKHSFVSQFGTGLVLGSTEHLQPQEESKPPEFELIPPEEKNKCYKAQAVIASNGGLWAA